MFEGTCGFCRSWIVTDIQRSVWGTQISEVDGCLERLPICYSCCSHCLSQLSCQKINWLSARLVEYYVDYIEFVQFEAQCRSDRISLLVQ